MFDTHRAPGSLLSSLSRRLRLGGALLALALPAGRALASAAPAAPWSPPAQGLEVATPGYYHADEVPLRDGETWWLALAEEQGVRFVPGALSVELVHAADEGLPDNMSLRADADAQPLFMLKGVPGRLLERAVSCQQLQQGLPLAPEGRVLDAGEVLRCPLPSQPRASLQARRLAPRAGQSGASEDASPRPASVELVLTDGERRQVLATYAEDGNQMGELVHVVWAGDLDGDGALDVLTDERLWYNQTVYLVLYLSSAATGEQLVAPVAHFEDVGC